MEDGTYTSINGELKPAGHIYGYYVAVRPYAEGETVPLGKYLGAWTDPATGHLYMDIAEWWPTQAMALHHAEQRGELAIWAISAATEVLTSHGRKARELAA